MEPTVNAEVQPPVTPPVTPATAPVTPAVDTAAIQELAALRAFKAEREAEARTLAEKKAVESGQAERVKEFYAKEVADREAKLADMDTRVRTAEKGRALSGALSGKPLIEFASDDLQALWANDFEVVDGPHGGFVARCKTTLRPVSEVVAERLASPRYAGFVQAASRGGSGNSGGGAASPTPAQTGQGPTLMDAILASQKAAQGGQNFGLFGSLSR